MSICTDHLYYISDMRLSTVHLTAQMQSPHRIRKAKAGYGQHSVCTLLNDRVFYLLGIAIPILILSASATVQVHALSSIRNRSLRYQSLRVRDDDQHVGQTAVESFHDLGQDPVTPFLSVKRHGNRLPSDRLLGRQFALTPDNTGQNQYAVSDTNTEFLQSTAHTWYNPVKVLPLGAQRWLHRKWGDAKTVMGVEGNYRWNNLDRYLSTENQRRIRTQLWKLTKWFTGYTKTIVDEVKESVTIKWKQGPWPKASRGTTNILLFAGNIFSGIHSYNKPNVSYSLHIATQLSEKNVDLHTVDNL
eukprot:GHVQ01001298.1.p1 GENE.GHVQ01001298.1~~GHVQ01001298.1.p1  ORF type:complete len:302 (-),score=9.75 GHVQ01001298.1:2148-3053(-)